MPAALLPLSSRVALVESVVHRVADGELDPDVALLQLAGIGLTAAPTALDDAVEAWRRYVDVEADNGNLDLYDDVPLGCSRHDAARRFLDEQLAAYLDAVADLAQPAVALGGAA